MVFLQLAEAYSIPGKIFSMTKKKIIIIGGGAAGFFCAANLDEKRFDVSILEQNAEVLQKVKISGGGRCNVTHACFDPAELVQFYPRGHKELRSVFHRFQPGDTMDWFEQRGVALKIEDDNRIFPESDSSQSITGTLLREVRKKKFTVKTKSTVLNIQVEAEKYLIETTGETFLADYVIFTTGSSPKSLRLLQQLGHNLVEAVPSLFTFNIKNATLSGLMGTAFPQATVALPSLKVEESGPLLITHWGLSGPAILKISAWKARELAARQYRFPLLVSFTGDTVAEATEKIQEYKQQKGKKQIGTAKIFEITARFWQRILEDSGVAPAKTVAALTAGEVRAIAEKLCGNAMEVSGKSTYKDEFVTAGGVELREVNFRNMASKILPRFYLAGEVLNIDAVTGGFNFQACWSEAWLIAQDLNSQPV